MILNDSEIRAKNIIAPTDFQTKHVTADLTIGGVAYLGDEASLSKSGALEVKKDVYIYPHQMVWIISSEVLKMPDDLTGFATLKTSLTKQGLLALNVGVIDPAYKGPIGSIVANFSAQPRLLKIGEPFLRVLFFNHSMPNKVHPYSYNNREKYVDEVLRNAPKFPNTFLDIANLTQKVNDKWWKIMWDKSRNFFAIMGFIAAGATITYHGSNLFAWISKNF